jgi:hypothetical protein
MEKTDMDVACDPRPGEAFELADLPDVVLGQGKHIDGSGGQNLTLLVKN